MPAESRGRVEPVLAEAREREQPNVRAGAAVRAAVVRTGLVVPRQPAPGARIGPPGPGYRARERVWSPLRAAGAT